MRTAVEWFESEFEKYYAFSTEEMETFTRMFNQAKQMEKEQKMEDYSVGYSNGQVDSNRTAEQYYNETYKNTKYEA